MNKPLMMTISLDLVLRLRGVGTGGIEHFGSLCPSWGENAAARRDPTCPACKVLIEVDAAIEHAAAPAPLRPCPPGILKRGGLLTSQEVALLAACDMKTIHNHAERGYLTVTRTPGRQLRIAPREALAYVKRNRPDAPAWLEALAAGEASSS